MPGHHSTVSERASFELCVADGAMFGVDCRLHYDPEDPYAVLAHFRLGDQQVHWVFGRALLAEGLDGPAGEGDVRVHPDTDEQGRPTVYIDLRSYGATARLRTRADNVRTFLESTYRVVPNGHESYWVDLDDGLTRLLAG